MAAYGKLVETKSMANIKKLADKINQLDNQELIQLVVELGKIEKGTVSLLGLISLMRNTALGNMTKLFEELKWS
jgi:hypothetical protein